MCLRAAAVSVSVSAEPPALGQQPYWITRRQRVPRLRQCVQAPAHPLLFPGLSSNPSYPSKPAPCLQIPLVMAFRKQETCQLPNVRGGVQSNQTSVIRPLGPPRKHVMVGQSLERRVLPEGTFYKGFGAEPLERGDSGGADFNCL